MSKTLSTLEIAKRLPYGVKYKFSNFFVSKDDSVGKLWRICDKIKMIGGSDGQNHTQNVKLILRPKSDLTDKDIDYMWFEIIGTDRDSFDKERFYELCHLGAFEFLPYMVIPYLLKNHFHIDEPEGTWIDVNTLSKNCYK